LNIFICEITSLLSEARNDNKNSIMKKKTVQKIIWWFISIIVIFTMVIWTIGLAFM